MKVTNRTDKTLTILVQGPGTPPYYQTWIHPGQGWDKHVQRDFATISVEPGEISGTGEGGYFTFPWNPMVKDAGPFSNRHELLLINGGRSFVDWTEVRATYLGEVSAITTHPEQPNPDLQENLKVASAIIGACATGLAALGPVGAAPATVVQMLASMMALAADGKEPPPPPDIGQIENVVERVVKQQSEKDFAIAATASFLRAQQWLLEADAALRSAADAERRSKAPAGAGKEGRRGPVDDFYEHLESWAKENAPFRGHMDVLCRNPEIAKWIIPAFLAGVGAHLQILRLHAVVNHKTDRGTILQFQREVDTCSKALRAAQNAWWLSYILPRLREDSIYQTPEGDWAYYTLNQAYHGAAILGPWPNDPPTADDKTPVGSAVFRLNQIHDYLEEDLKAIDNGKSPVHFYKPQWEQTPLATT